MLIPKIGDSHNRDLCNRAQLGLDLAERHNKEIISIFGAGVGSILGSSWVS